MPMLSAQRNVELPLLLTKLGSAQRKKNAAIALQLVGLQDRGSHKPASYRAVSSNVSLLRARLFPTPVCWYATNRPAIWIVNRPKTYWVYCASSTASTAKPSSWSRTIPKRPNTPTIRCTSTRARWSSRRRPEEAAMKYLHLIWAALFRRKTRTILTLVSIVAAFLLFGMLDAVRTSFNQAGASANGAQRLQTGSKLSFIDTLPQGLGAQIEQVPGVKSVAYANWFGGAYQDPHNQIFSFAVSDNYIDLYPEVEVSPEARKTFDTTRTGILIGEQLAKKYNWKVGDQIPLQSTIFPQHDGSKNWTFNVAGIMHAKDKAAGWYDQIILMHWKYFDDSTPYSHGTVGWYVTRVADINQADRVAKAIDAISANSDHETRTQTEAAASASWMKQLADIGLIVGSIMGAVFFTLLLLTGNTMMQAVRERTSELAVLKTIGFSNRGILAMVLAESLLLVIIGGVIGVALAALLIPMVSANSGGMLNLPTVGLNSWGLGIGLMVLIGLAVGAIPAIRAMRLNIVDALAGR